jgi:hypothetical protein
MTKLPSTLPKGVYLGGLCKRQHGYKNTNMSLRYKRGSCLKCHEVTTTRYNENNVERISEHHRKRYQNNKKHIKKIVRAWRKKNPHKLKEYQRNRNRKKKKKGDNQ